MESVKPCFWCISYISKLANTVQIQSKPYFLNYGKSVGNSRSTHIKRWHENVGSGYHHHIQAWINDNQSIKVHAPRLDSVCHVSRLAEFHKLNFQFPVEKFTRQNYNPLKIWYLKKVFFVGNHLEKCVFFCMMFSWSSMMLIDFQGMLCFLCNFFCFRSNFT